MRRLETLLPVFFVAFALPVCLFFALAMPPGQAPDEPAHIARADSLLHWQILGTRRPATSAHVAEAVIRFDPSLLFVTFPFKDNLHLSGMKMTPALQRQLRAIPWNGARTFSVVNTAVYFPVFYIPSALAIGGTRLLRGSPYDALVAGRLVNALVYILAGALALRVAPRGRRLLFALLCLPMTLSLAASFNPDGLLLATMALAVALLGRGLEAGANAGRQPGFWIAAAGLACAFAVKPPYLTFAVLFLLPLDTLLRRPALLRRRLPALALVVLPALVWSFVALRYVSVPFTRPAYAPGPLWPGSHTVLFHATNPLAQLAVLRADPTRLISLPWRTLFSPGMPGLLWQQMIGVIGDLDVVLPGWLYGLWSAALIAAVLGDMAETEGAGMADTAALLIAAMVCLLGIYVIEYLTWTNVGRAAISGVQGRYLLPMLAPLALALPALHVRNTEPLRRLCTLVLLAAPAAGLFALPHVILAQFYPS